MAPRQTDITADIANGRGQTAKFRIEEATEQRTPWVQTTKDGVPVT